MNITEYIFIRDDVLHCSAVQFGLQATLILLCGCIRGGGGETSFAFRLMWYILFKEHLELFYLKHTGVLLHVFSLALIAPGSL